MAGFKTHFATAAIGGGVVAIALLTAHRAAPPEVVLYFFAAILGGLLPDVDADHSTLLAGGFTLAAVVLSFLTVFALGARYTVVELLLVWGAIYLLIRVVVFQWFIRHTEHRGIFHSLPAGAAWAGLAVVLLHHGFHYRAAVAWLAGAFLLGGYLLHLLLDELYSLNLFGARQRTSLGSAFKLWSNDPLATALVYALAVLAWLAAPAWQEGWGTPWQGETWRALAAGLWPRHGWFGW